MEGNNIGNILKENYDLNVQSVEKVKNTYKVNTDNGGYCLKIIKYQYPHFYFIISAIKHLQSKGAINIPTIIKTKSNNDFIEIDNKYSYLTKWIDVRESNYSNPVELKNIVREIATLHQLSEGFTLEKSMQPRVGWFKWISTYETRKNEMLDFKKRIYQKAYKSNFDNIYLSIMSEEIERADKYIEILKNSKYFEIMERQVFKRGFCHHDLANHNILIDSKGKINFIDFDYCILDSNLHDVASLLIRNMKNSKWEEEKANLILNEYNNIRSIDKDEMEVIRGFIGFPQDYWQVGIQYYWEMQPWKEEIFMNKLMRYINDRRDKEEFLDSFFSN